MTTPIETYNQRDLGFLSYYAPRIAAVASQLSTQSSFSAIALQQIIAAPLIEEFHDRYETSWNNAVQFGADIYVGALSEQELQESFDRTNANPGQLPQVPDLLEKLRNPIIIDVGPANIQLFTAVNLLNDYIATNPNSDPLGIKQYSGNITELARDLTDPTTGATAAFAGDNVFARVAASSALGTLLQNVGQAFGETLDTGVDLLTAAYDAFDNFSTELGASFRASGLGAVSSFLTAELAESFGLDGSDFGEEASDALLSRLLCAVANDNGAQVELAHVA